MDTPPAGMVGLSAVTVRLVRLLPMRFRPMSAAVPEFSVSPYGPDTLPAVWKFSGELLELIVAGPFSNSTPASKLMPL